MNQTRTSMTPPWIPVGLSTLVLLGLVVVLSLNPNPPHRASEFTTNSIAPSTTSPASPLITKILWRTPTTVVSRPANQSTGNGNFKDTFPIVSVGDPVSGTILEAPYDVSAVGVSQGQSIHVTMTPQGVLNLQCGESALLVDFDFIVPSDATSCLLEISGSPGSAWKVEVRA